MRTAVVILNILLFMFASFIISTEGPPAPGEDTAFVVFSLANRLFSIIMILLTVNAGHRIGIQNRLKHLHLPQNSTKSALLIDNLTGLAVISNLIDLGFVCFHLSTQYNHPDESGIFIMAAIMILLPIFNIIVLYGSIPKSIQLRSTE